ncbi:MAG: hypothetical protein IPO40_24925 [Fibrobacteres bacterium]|nr:hypothetical protein [Fibrobacterota bacterium]
MKKMNRTEETPYCSHAIIISKTGTIVSWGDLAHAKKMIKFHGDQCEIVKLI